MCRFVHVVDWNNMKTIFVLECTRGKCQQTEEQYE
jgi:hypothetical protein